MVLRKANSSGLNLSDKRYKPVSVSEEQALFKIAIQGDARAYRRIIESNMKFVRNVANMYTGRGVEREDLIQEGTLGMHRAMKRYNPATGNRFISFGVWWIRVYMVRAIARQSRSYDLPERILTSLSNFDKTRDALAQELQRLPTLGELAEACEMPEDALVLTMAHYQGAVSLDTASPEGDGSLLDTLPDPEAQSDERAVEGLQTRYIAKLLSCLDPRERRLVRDYYGLDLGEGRTLDQVGSRAGITKERVRQILKGAKAKLAKAGKRLGKP